MNFLKNLFLKFTIFLLLATLLFTQGCSGIPVSWDEKGTTAVYLEGTSMSEAEVRIISLYYMGESEAFYKDLLGDDFWLFSVYGGEETYEKFVLENYVWPECKALLYLEKIAARSDIHVSEFEEETILEYANLYYASLSEGALSFSKASSGDVYNVLYRYYLADKTITSLLSGLKTEVSDEESRACDIQVIRLSDESSAEAVYERILSGENFLTVAKETTLDDKISYTVSRELIKDDLCELIFSMDEGEVSEPVLFGDRYYIFKMDQSYNSLQSLNNKKNLLARLRFENWEDAYLSMEEDMTIRRNENVFSGIRFSEAEDIRQGDLFQLFND